MELNNYLEALNCYTKSLQLDTKLSKNSEYLTLKGKALKQLGKIDASIKCFDEAIKSNTLTSKLELQQFSATSN